MSGSQTQFTIDLDAHSIDDEFEKIIRDSYNVKILDRTGEPWSVIFQGTRDDLLKMVKDLWSEDMVLNDDDFSVVN